MDRSDDNLMRNAWIDNVMTPFDNNSQGNNTFAPSELLADAWTQHESSSRNTSTFTNHADADHNQKQQSSLWSVSTGANADLTSQLSVQQHGNATTSAMQGHNAGQVQLQRSKTDDLTGKPTITQHDNPSSREPIWQRRLNSRKQEIYHAISDSQIPRVTSPHSAGKETNATAMNAAVEDSERAQQISYAPSTFESNYTTVSNVAPGQNSDAQRNELARMMDEGYQTSYHASDKPMLDALMASGSFTGMPSAAATGVTSDASSQAHYDRSVGAGSAFDPLLTQKPQRSESMGSESSTSSVGSFTGDLVSSFYGPIQGTAEIARGRGAQRSPTSPRKVTSSMNDDMTHGTINASKGHRRQRPSIASDITVKTKGSSLFGSEELPETNCAALSGAGKGVINKLVVSKGIKMQGDSDGDEDHEVRHVCPVEGCDKHFSTSGHARRHSRIHAALRPFECPHEACGATFTRRDNCTQHQRARHNSQLVAHRIPAERFDIESRP